MAGFQVTLHGRFWVITEVCQGLAENQLVAPSRFDFVESVENDSALIRYCDALAKRFLA
jgi:hypothetical protein